MLAPERRPFSQVGIKWRALPRGAGSAGVFNGVAPGASAARSQRRRRALARIAASAGPALGRLNVVAAGKAGSSGAPGGVAPGASAARSPWRRGPVGRSLARVFFLRPARELLRALSMDEVVPVVGPQDPQEDAQRQDKEREQVIPLVSERRPDDPALHAGSPSETWKQAGLV